MKLTTERTSLIVLLFLALVCYTYKLNSVPPGLYVDEAVTAYNAYTLADTGKDEYGESWPILLRFFGSYSPPLYTYLTAPLIAITGLQIASVRIISVIFGIFTVWLSWQWLHNLPLKWRWSTLLGATLLSLSPWQLLYARTGYEVYLGAFLWWLSIWCWWTSYQYPKRLVISLLFLSLSTYGAHTERFLAPFTLFSFFVIDYRMVLNKAYRQFLIIGIFIAALIQIPHLFVIQTPAFWSKQQLAFTQQLEPAIHKLPNFLPNWLANLIVTVREPLSRWLTYYSPGSLFFWPDPDPQRSLPDVSVFFVWMIIPYLAGWYYLWRHHQQREMKLLLAALIIAPLPAALTTDPFNTQRALPLFLLINILIALGVDQLISYLQSRWRWMIVTALLLWSSLNLWRSYFVLLPLERAAAWNYGSQQLAQALQIYSAEPVIIDQSRSKPLYIQLAFWLSLPPSTIQASADPAISKHYYHTLEFHPERRFANFDIRPINWETDIYHPQILVGDGLAISPQQASEHALTLLFTIKDPQGKILFQGYRTDPARKCQNSPPNNPSCITQSTSL